MSKVASSYGDNPIAERKAVACKYWVSHRKVRENADGSASWRCVEVYCKGRL